MKNYYKILGVPYHATSDAIKNAYRLKAKKYHPDIRKGSDAKQKFQLINEAYQLLKDERKRRYYDYRLRVELAKRQNVYNQPVYKTKYTHRHYYTSKAYRKQDSGFKYEKVFDNLVFLFMLIIGLYLIIFGFYRLFFAPVEGVNSLAGIISGFIFTSVIIYAWLLRIKK